MSTELSAAVDLASRWIDGVSKATRLDGERDLNFRVESSRGTSYLLKVHHSESNLDDLDLQNAALGHLERSEVHGVPRVLPMSNGDRLATVTWGDGTRYARLLTWLGGRMWADLPPTPSRMAGLGRLLAAVDDALADFEHPAGGRPDSLWRITAAPRVASFTSEVNQPTRAVVERMMRRYVSRVEPRVQGLPTQLVHHDANEHNIVIDTEGNVSGIIDFGDVVVAPRVAELAVACAYAMQGSEDPIAAILPLVRGYDSVLPITVEEVSVLVDLIAVRLSMSICMSARQQRRDPSNSYLAISQAGVTEALVKLDKLDPDLCTYRIRNALGFDPNPDARVIRRYFESGAAAPARMIDPCATFDDGDLDHYLNSRADGEISLRRTLAARTSSEVRSPLNAIIGDVRHDTVILGHRTADAKDFWTVVRGVVPASGLVVGEWISKGSVLGTVMPSDGFRGGLLDIQIITVESLVKQNRASADPEDIDLWRGLYLDPNLVLREPTPVTGRPPRKTPELIHRRGTNFSRAMGLSYRDPLHIVRGRGPYLFDQDGRQWLDMVNNVCHVGHAHPRVVEAAHEQSMTLNTNTRYLHDSVVEYSRRIVELMPDPLRVCFFVNSGSEANDLALRLAKAHTAARDVLVLDHAYHGHLSSQIGLSPYKFDRAGGEGAPETTWVCELPDVYRGRLRHGRDDEIVSGYVASVEANVEAMHRLARSPAAFYVEAMQSCGGQIVLPDGYLEKTFSVARAAGAVCVADEVQIGLGRVGSHFWAFERHGVVPDIVTLGKPLGNGHPLAAVVTTPEVARSFETGMEWFNTFGGNPVSAEVGISVLDVIRDERLQENASRIGERMVRGLRDIAARHEAVGDVRGAGLFLGVELSRVDRHPATAVAESVKEYAKSAGVLLSTDGPDGNVIKIKPPMVIGADDCDFFLEVFDAALQQVAETC